MNRVFSGVVVTVSLGLFAVLALLAAGLLPYRAYVVKTGSMEPSIARNSVVLVHEGVFQPGQPITFNTVNGPVTHRLVGQRLDGELITKGDANRTPDPGYVAPQHVVGGVVASVPLLGYAIAYLQNPLGLASVLLATVALWLAGSIWLRPLTA